MSIQPFPKLVCRSLIIGSEWGNDNTGMFFFLRLENMHMAMGKPQLVRSKQCHVHFVLQKTEGFREVSRWFIAQKRQSRREKQTSPGVLVRFFLKLDFFSDA